MRAVSYFEQIEKETLDGNNNIEALKNFEKLINRFPSSKYSRDSKQKIIYVKENIAAKHMNIAFFYLKKKQYYAAMGRYQEVIDNYSQSKFIPEALYRLVEIYYNLGMLEDAKKTASVIGFNYPQSKWYNYAYVLLKNNQSKNDMKLIKKFYNFFKINDNKK
jgi:outer membrane protein assembly factor BamD